MTSSCVPTSGTCSARVRRARSLSWNHVHSSDMVMQTSFYQRWSTVRQRPETIDRYGAQTNAERTLGTFGIKSDVTRVSGRHALKGGVDLVMLRPAGGSVLPESALDRLHASARHQREPRAFPRPEPRCRHATARRVQRRGNRRAGESLRAGQSAGRRRASRSTWVCGSIATALPSPSLMSARG